MLELGDQDPIMQQAKEFGSFEWAPFGTLAANTHKVLTGASRQ